MCPEGPRGQARSLGVPSTLQSSQRGSRVTWESLRMQVGLSGASLQQEVKNPVWTGLLTIC